MQSTSRFSSVARAVAALVTIAAVTLVASCGDRTISAPSRTAASARHEPVVALRCTATIAPAAVTCGPAQSLASSAASRNILGNQNTYVKLTSSNVSYDPCMQTFEFDATVQNLLNEAMGTPDGTLVDTTGIRVFFQQMPTVTAGTGTVTVPSPDGIGTFTASNQPYYEYNGILAHNAVSSVKRWQLNVPPTATAVQFTVLVSTTVQSMLVINEVLANPGGTISDANGEWFEVYNAGTLAVDMQGYLLADSAVSGPRPPHTIASSLNVPSGGYVVFGETTNTTNNGGVPVDYAYGSAIALANSIRAIKLSRVFTDATGTPNTLTIDYVQYTSAAISAQNGISRELKNPALNNLNIDGSNWADASVTAVYGPGGRGTPKAQNAAFVP